MHKVIVSDLLATHALSGCDTVPSLYGIGKQKALKALRVDPTTHPRVFYRLVLMESCPFPSENQTVSHRVSSPSSGRAFRLMLRPSTAQLVFVSYEYLNPPLKLVQPGSSLLSAAPSVPASSTSSFSLFLVLFLVLSCIGGYSLWRRWHPAISRCWCFCCCCRSSGELGDEDPNSEQESTRSCCPPPHYSRCSSLRHAPPPYTEVTSKPDLYPLVISYGDSGKTGPGSSYLMVQYFRNYIVRPVAAKLASNMNRLNYLTVSRSQSIPVSTCWAAKLALGGEVEPIKGQGYSYRPIGSMYYLGIPSTNKLQAVKQKMGRF
uniref:WW domain binding protein VOPP1 n=1 Tax=Timema shepardi TaxID=629360 RepID=A0A7R9AYQ7_TIMSH|nr:unnamed protein product [Timema shepardi]